ncbi:MAG: FecR domain-containing protein [Bacteroidota bacterium]
MEAANKHLLKKFLSEQCNDAELQQVQALLQQPEGKEILDELIAEQASAEWNTPVETDEAMLKRLQLRKAEVNQRIKAESQSFPAKEDNRQVKKLSFLKYAAIWATVVMLAGLAVWKVTNTSSQNQVAYIEKINRQGLPVRYALPDSSEVFLSAGSKLRYPDNFDGDKREIELQGEAFFQVRHMEAKPFIIHTGEINTQVLGTSFKVQAFSGQPIVVAVATGKVGVSRHQTDQSNTLAMLTPGQKVTWNSSTGKAILGSVDVYTLEQWKSGELIFDELELGQVAKQLKARYGVDITIIDKETETYQISGTFSADEPVGKVLKMLSVLGKFRYETNDNKSYKIYKTE